MERGREPRRKIEGGGGGVCFSEQRNRDGAKRRRGWEGWGRGKGLKTDSATKREVGRLACILTLASIAASAVWSPVSRRLKSS